MKDTLKEDVFFLILKVILFVVLIAILFLFVFGIYRCSDNTMNPAVKDGDLAIYYRLQKNYNVSDVVVLEKDGEKQLRRIIAKEGDKIDITEEGLVINGYLQQEREIYTETLPYVEGITFPLTVGKNEYFVLGDNRPNVKDSRVYGVVKQQEMKGVVITILRSRGI